MEESPGLMACNSERHAPAAAARLWVESAHSGSGAIRVSQTEDVFYAALSKAEAEATQRQDAKAQSQVQEAGDKEQPATCNAHSASFSILEIREGRFARILSHGAPLPFWVRGATRFLS